jgi:hypothetical protein
MSKLAKYIGKYEEELLTKAKVKSVDSKLLYEVTKACGPSIYNRDASKVSFSDKKELERVKISFLIKKLGLKDGEYLDTGINAVAHQIGIRNRNKYRAIFYYLLVKHFNARSVFVKESAEEKPIDKLVSFGEKFLKSQKTIDSEIRIATDKNFGDLLL